MSIDKETIQGVIMITVWVIAIIGILLCFKWDIDTTLKDNRLALKPCFKYKDYRTETYQLKKDDYSFPTREFKYFNCIDITIDSLSESWVNFLLPPDPKERGLRRKTWLVRTQRRQPFL